MIEEAKLDDLFNLIASETGQEIHKLMQVMANNDEKLMAEADAVRQLRQEHERDFFGIEKNDVEKFRRSGIGEGGCDFKHCCINFIHCLEVAQKELRLWSEDKKEEHKNKALLYLKSAEIYKNMAFEIRNRFGGENG